MPDRLLEAKKGNNVARMCSAALTGGEKWGKRFPRVRYAVSIRGSTCVDKV